MWRKISVTSSSSSDAKRRIFSAYKLFSAHSTLVLLGFFLYSVKTNPSHFFVLGVHFLPLVSKISMSVESEH